MLAFTTQVLVACAWPALTGALPTPGDQLEASAIPAKFARQVSTATPAPVGFLSEPFRMPESMLNGTHHLTDGFNTLAKRDEPWCFDVQGVNGGDVGPAFYGIAGIPGTIDIAYDECRSYTYGTVKSSVCNPYEGHVATTDGGQ